MATRVASRYSVDISMLLILFIAGCFSISVGQATQHSNQTLDDTSFNYTASDEMSFNSYVLPALIPISDMLPNIDPDTMDLHQTKHFAGYTKKMNAALSTLATQDPDMVKEDIYTILSRVADIQDPDVRTSLINNGGGYVNHHLYFGTMIKPSDYKNITDIPECKELLSQIEKTFGGFDEFKQIFTDSASGVFGSGWAMLYYDDNSTLAISNFPNQNTSALMMGASPILGLDVWEHAYYKMYGNLRGDYIDAWWSIVNWLRVCDPPSPEYTLARKKR